MVEVSLNDRSITVFEGGYGTRGDYLMIKLTGTGDRWSCRTGGESPVVFDRR